MTLDKSTLLKVALAVLAVAGLVYLVQFDRMVDAAASADVTWVVLSLALVPLNAGLKGVVWYRLARRIAPALTKGEALGSLLCGFSLGFLTPARAGEFAGRAFYLRHEQKWALAAAALAQNLFLIAGGLLVGLPAFAAEVTAGWLPSGSLWWGLMAAGAIVTFVLNAAVFRPALLLRVLGRIVRSDEIRRQLHDLQDVPLPETLRLLGLGIVTFGVIVLQLVLLLAAFHPPITAVHLFSSVVVVYFIKFIVPPVTFTDLGIREGIAVFVLGAIGMDPAAALNASLLMYCVNQALPAAAGVPFVFRMRLRVGVPDALAPDQEPVPHTIGNDG